MKVVISKHRSAIPFLLLGCVIGLMFVSNLRAADSEQPVRDAFTKQFKDKDPKKRVEAVKTLADVKEDKSILLLASALKDPAFPVRRAAAETLEGVTDGGGVALKDLCTVVANKKEEIPVRLGAARAVAKSPYKAEPIKALIIAISLEESDVLLYAFGMECTKILNGVAGQDFGIDKETPGKWKDWWKANEKKIESADKETLAAYKKASKEKGK